MIMFGYLPTSPISGLTFVFQFGNTNNIHVLTRYDQKLEFEIVISYFSKGKESVQSTAWKRRTWNLIPPTCKIQRSHMISCVHTQGLIDMFWATYRKTWPKDKLIHNQHNPLSLWYTLTNNVGRISSQFCESPSLGSPWCPPQLLWHYRSIRNVFHLELLHELDQGNRLDACRVQIYTNGSPCHLHSAGHILIVA